MVPTEELDYFALAYTDAITMGLEGRMSAGLLLITLYRSEAILRDELWSAELVRVWDAALTQYRRRFLRAASNFPSGELRLYARQVVDRSARLRDKSAGLLRLSQRLRNLQADKAVSGEADQQ